MLRSIKHLYGAKLGASDGEIGHVKDFYFDDRKWVIRYVVADTGSWLLGRLVLITPHAVRNFNPAETVLRVDLTRKQIEKSPAIESHKPVSRQYEEDFYRYYGWPFYWRGNALWGMSGFPILESPPNALPGEPAPALGLQPQGADSHLRSTHAVNGYQFKASDGTVGHVCDFMMDDKNWAIAQWVVKTGHRLSGTEVRIPSSQVERISYDDSTVYANVTAAAVLQSPQHRASEAGEPG
jgi:hypothetical protein